MPLTMPDPKYRSMPSSVVGGTTRSCVVLNCKPCVRSVIHQPSPSMYSPGVMVGAVPTTVTRSRVATHLDAEHAEPCVLTVERDAFYRASELLGRHVGCGHGGA